jgi:hypothetical protein
VLAGMVDADRLAMGCRWAGDGLWWEEMSRRGTFRVPNPT